MNEAAAPVEETEPVDAEVVEERGSGALTVQRHEAATTLFGTNDPNAVLKTATDVANALKQVISQQQLITRIGQGEHVRVEGWQTVGSMLGVFAVENWTRELPTPQGKEPHAKGAWGYESRYEAKTRDGAVVGAGVARCTRTEGSWANRDDYALESMAQTRATTKALKAPLGWIVALAGFQSTPAEEMVPDTAAKPEAPASDALVVEVERVLPDLLHGHKANAAKVLKVVRGDNDGALPAAVGRALVLLGRAEEASRPQETRG